MRIGTFETHPFFAMIAATAVIFAAVYLLWSLQRILFNPLDKPENEHLKDLNWRELTIMGTLTVLILWLGLYPAPVLRRMQSSAERFVHQVETRGARSNSTLGGR